MKNYSSSCSFHSFKSLDGLSALDANHLKNNFAPHFHETFQLTWNRSGLFENQINDKTLRSLPNTMALSHPKEVHATNCNQPLGHTFFTLYLPPTLFNQDFSSGDKKLAHSFTDNQLMCIMNQIRNSIKENKTPDEKMVFNLISRLQSVFVTHKSKGRCHSELTLFAETNFLEPFNLDQWVAQTGINKFKLIRVFRSETGMTPNQFVIHQRVQHSLKGLQEGQTIIDVALSSGFFDAAHYYKNFKKIIGITPRMFQQAFLKNLAISYKN